MDSKTRGGNGINGINLKLNSPKFSDENENTENKLNSNINTKSEEYKPKKVIKIN